MEAAAAAVIAAGGAGAFNEAGGGGGGGSFNDSIYTNANFINLSGVNSGNGFVTITAVNAVPEPSSLVLFGIGALVAGGFRSRRKRKTSG